MSRFVGRISKRLCDVCIRRVEGVPVRSVGRESDRWCFVIDKLRDDVRGRGGKKDSVAIVAGGEKMICLAGKRAQDGEAVRSRRAKACPTFKLWRVGKWGQ